MPQAVLGGFLVLHGLITTVIGLGGITNPNAPAMALPSWISRWPGPFGRSWLFEALHLGSGASIVGGFVWLVAGLALIGAGLSWLGVPGAREAWQLLALGGAGAGLLAIALYFHPLYLLARSSTALIVVLLWGQLATAS